MKILKTCLACPAPVLLLMTALVFTAGSGASAQEVTHLRRAQPGGMPGLPVITGITRGTNDVTVTWDAPSGDFQLLQKLGLADSQWHPIGKGSHQAASSLRTATVPKASSSAALFKISGPSPQYAGSRACLECHSPMVNTVTHTRHSGASASALFAAQGGRTDPSCLPCHSVGFGLPTGFVGEFTTPHLANVQCENCHGPAAVHAANPEDPVTKPRVELSAMLCGGCHNSEFVPARVAALHPPRYEEWNASAHQSVRDDLKADFAGRLGSSYFIPACGSCHSGTVRQALIQNAPLPTGHEAGAIGIACGTCHDSHQQYVHANLLDGLRTNLLTGFVITNNQLGKFYTNQMRSPLASLADYHSTGSFATNYNPEINVCAQCHNDLGASAKTLDVPPHRSSQYNMLLGTFRQEDTGVPSNRAGSHALLEKQCVACHMQEPAGSGGHSFMVKSYDLCSKCHVSPELLVQFTTNAVLYQIQRDKAALDFWAMLKAPAALQKYGAKAWEYSNAGSLSGPGPSPTTAEQGLIPVNIQKARFNLYLVFNEGSFGVHNGPYTVDLLFAAYSLVVDELKK
jgi:hypothetical protein